MGWPANLCKRRGTASCRNRIEYTNRDLEDLLRPFLIGLPLRPLFYLRFLLVNQHGLDPAWNARYRRVDRQCHSMAQITLPHGEEN